MVTSWPTAGEIGLLARDEVTFRIRSAIHSLERLERHLPSGQFYNWYDSATGAMLTTWPEPPRNPVHPFLSSVDSGWLASALLVVAAAFSELEERARALAMGMDFASYYDPNAKGGHVGPGLLRVGVWRSDDVPPGSADFPRHDHRGMGGTALYTSGHYVLLNSESRIASYIGIALGQIPAVHYFAPWRTFPDSCDWTRQRQGPVGTWKNYLGVDVFEGAYRYREKLVVPTWGGSMFEALMPTLIVHEERWGPASWGVTHPLYVESQIEYGVEEASYGYWGFSPSSDPAGSYREYGVAQIGMSADGYTSDEQRLTLSDLGWDDPDCGREPRPIPDYGNGVVSPHAAFPALASTLKRPSPTSEHWSLTFPASTDGAASKMRSTS